MLGPLGGGDRDRGALHNRCLIFLALAARLPAPPSATEAMRAAEHTKVLRR